MGKKCHEGKSCPYCYPRNAAGRLKPSDRRKVQPETGIEYSDAALEFGMSNDDFCPECGCITTDALTHCAPAPIDVAQLRAAWEDRVPHSRAWAIAQLRHLYKQLLDGTVGDQRAAARGLLGPAIEILER